jgi:hypothetical protein
MRSFAARLRGAGQVAVWASLEGSQGFEAVSEAEPLWMQAIYLRCRAQLPAELAPPAPEGSLGLPVGSRLGSWLRAWSQGLGRRVVLLLDEADVVSGPALVSLMRQLRDGFHDRLDGHFPTSIGLIGMRDLRDYLTLAKDGRPVNPGSPFNIKRSSLTLRGFRSDELARLVGQHSAETGQVFSEAALERLWHYSQGQPFLVNALADGVVRRIARPPEQVEAAHVERAREELVLSRTTHLDALAQRLLEPRVARILSAVMVGAPSYTVTGRSDDLLYCEDLGLLRSSPRVEVANPIYREVLARELSSLTEPDLPERAWLKGGRLDMELLVGEFLSFWRRNAEALRGQDLGAYRESVPQLVFMAWLQRIVNGGGRISREYALGRGRLDLLVEVGGERFAIELKRVTRHDGLETVKEEGVEQLWGYLDHLGLKEGWLLIFDERAGMSWQERLWQEERRERGLRLHLRGG